MKAKHICTALLMIMIFAAGFIPAQASAIEVEAGAYVGVYDKYLWRGADLSAGQPVVQGGIDLSANGFTYSVWSNVDLSGSNSDEATETDFVLDYSFAASDILSVSVGDIYYTFGPDGGSTHELYLGLGLDLPLAPALTVYYDWDEASTADVDGLFYSLSIGHDLDLNEKTGLSLGAAVNYNQESPFVGEFSDFNTADLSAAVSYAINDQLSVDLSYLYSLVLSDDAEDIGGLDDDGLVGLNIGISF